MRQMLQRRAGPKRSRRRVPYGRVWPRRL